MSCWKVGSSRGGALPPPYKYSVAIVIAIAIVFYTLLTSVRTGAERGCLAGIVAVHAILME